MFRYILVALYLTLPPLAFFATYSGLSAAFPGKTAQPVLAMSAESLMLQIEENPASLSPYSGRIVRITGKMRDVSANIQGECFLQFDAKGRSPRCFSSPAAYAHLKKGDTITVQGELRTNGGLVDVAGCKLVSP